MRCIRSEEVGHLRCARDCALDLIWFRACNCMFYIPTSTASFPCQYGLGPRVPWFASHLSANRTWKIWRWPIGIEVMSFVMVLIGQCWITTVLLLTRDLQTMVNV